MRIISLCPSNTELLAYLDLEDYLIAVDDYSDYPSVVNNLPKLGPDLSIDLNQVENLQPDLVLASLSVPGMEKNIEGLQNRQIPHVVFNPNSLDDIANDLLTLGMLTGHESVSKRVVADYRNTIQHYKQLASGIQFKPTIYWEWWPNPIFSPGGRNWLTEISALAGATNLFQDVQLASVQTNWADVVARNPDHICLAWVGVKHDKMKKETIEKRQGSDTLPAVISDNIHLLEEHLYCRPSPRLLLGLKKLAYLIHPTHYPER